MKLQKFTPVLLVAVMFVVAGCNKTKKLANRLEGTWNIDKQEGTFTPAGSTVGAPYSYSNAGTIVFKDDKTGTLSADFMGVTISVNFAWSNTESTVTITPSGDPAQVYTVTTNEKTKQVWTSTTTDADGTDNETLTLSKK